MTGSARIGLAATLLLAGVSFAMAQNGPATGGYPPGAQNPTSTATMATTATTRHLVAMGLDRPTGFSAIPSHTTAANLGAAGGGKHNLPLSRICRIPASFAASFILPLRLWPRPDRARICRSPAGRPCRSRASASCRAPPLRQGASIRRHAWIAHSS